MKNIFLRQALADFSRQAISLVPLVSLFFLSREKTYLTVSILTSATTIASAILLVGVNFVVLLNGRKEQINLVAGFLISTSPLVFVIAMFISQSFGGSNFKEAETSLLVIAGEICFGHVQQQVARFSIAEWKVSAVWFGNVISPLLRGFALVALISQEFALFGAIFYLSTQIAVTFIVFKTMKIRVDFGFARKPSFKSILKVGIPNWLSSLGVTLIDNLIIIFLAALGNKTLAANLIFSIRVFGAASSPVQSIAALRLTREPRKLREEIFLGFAFGLGASIFGLLVICAVVLFFPGHLDLTAMVVLPLALFAVFRTISTFIGNRLTLLGQHWRRVSATIATLFSLISGLVALFYFKSDLGQWPTPVLFVIGVEFLLFSFLAISSRNPSL